MVNLEFVESIADVRKSIEAFSTSLKANQEVGASLARTTTYWVLDESTGNYAPSKFVGFRAMDFEMYRKGRLNDYGGDRFNGYDTRIAIETVTDKSFKKSKALSSGLSDWLETRLGPDTLKNVSTEKWRFIEVPQAERYWAFMAKPEIYDIERAVKELKVDTWTIEKSDVKKGDKAIIWKAKGSEDKRGIIALADVLSDPQIMEASSKEQKYYKVQEKEKPARRVLVEYSIQPCFPLWLDDDQTGLLSSLSVSRATGGTVFKVTPAQWLKVISLVEASGNAHDSNKVLLKEVGKSQHKDGVRVDKAFHDIFNPPNSPLHVTRGTSRKVKVAFNGKEFDAEYRFEGTKAKEVDLQRIGFFKQLREEFKEVFPIPRGTFTIRLGSDLNHFIFDHERVTAEVFNNQLEEEISKSKKDGKEARQKRLAEAVRKPASIQVTSVAFIRNADVIVEVLERAGGKCEACLKDAPFLRAKNKTPYLEVHHKVPLSDGGEDVVENALAVCPNCHRKMHYG